MSRSPIRQKTVIEGDRIYNVWEQTSRGTILAHNAERRKDNPRKSDWIKPLASIPLEDHAVLSRERPDLFRDRRRLERFINSSEGKKFRTTPRGRSRNFSFGGV